MAELAKCPICGQDYAIVPANIDQSVCPACKRSSRNQQQRVGLW